MSAAAHTISKAIVRVGGGRMFRARCSCADFEVSVLRFSTAARRKQDRLIREHLDGTAALPQVAE